MIGALVGSFFGPNKAVQMAVGGAIIAGLVAGGITWLRHDAAMDERRGAVAASNAEVIEVLKTRNKIEREMDDASSDDLRDILGIPH